MAERTVILLQELVGDQRAREIARDRITTIVRERPGLSLAELKRELIRRNWMVADDADSLCDAIGLEPTDTLHPRRGHLDA